MPAAPIRIAFPHAWPIQHLAPLHRRRDAVLAIGSADRDVCGAIDVLVDRIFPIPCAVGPDRFIAASRLPATGHREMRAAS